MNLVTTTLADIVSTIPASARVFERHGLDYCCHGGQTLDEASTAAGVDAAIVSAELDALPKATADWATFDIPTLADHILEAHHVYLHEELPLLVALAAKVASVHGERHPELAEVHRLVVAVNDDLVPHLEKEEQMMFPAIHAAVAGQREFAFGSVADEIRTLVEEHEELGELLLQLRAATGAYEVPADGCASYTSLYQRLHEMETDTHLHIHKENHLLFPAAVALADA